MLEFLRRNAQSLFFQIIVVVIILAFVFWGGSSMMNNRQAAITVDKEEIGFQEVDQAYNKSYAQLAEQFGGQLPKGLAETFGLKQQVINQLVRDSLLRQGATEMGVVVSANEIQQEIQNMIQFQDANGFNIDRYKEVLSSNRLSPTKFENQMKRDMLAQKTIDDISKFINLTTDFEINDLYTIEGESVAVEFVKISPSDFNDSIEITDEELTAWFDTNKDNYKSAPELKLKYILYSFDEISKKLTVEDSEIEKYYQTNIAAYQTAESRKAKHILLKATDTDSEELHAEKMQKAEEVLKLANDGSDFSELAKEYSEGPSGPEGGELGFFQQGQMVPEFDEATFKLEKGGISGVVKTAFGYHIIKLEDITPATTRSLDEVKDSIVATLSLKQAKPMAFQIANKAYEGIIGAGSLDNFAKENDDATIVETDFFAQSEPPAAIKNNQQFIEKAFQLKKGELSSLIETGDGYAIMFASDIKAPEVPVLDSVKDRVIADYNVEQSATLAKEAAETFITTLTENKDFAKTATESKTDVKESGFFTKATPNADSGFPAALTTQAFRLSKTQPFPTEPAVVGEDYYVFFLQERKAPETSISNEEKVRYEATLKQLKQQQLLSAWIKNQEEGTVVTVHSSLQE